MVHLIIVKLQHNSDAITLYITMVTNQNRLTPIFRKKILFDKFEGNTFLHNVLKNLVPSMSLYVPSFRQLSKPAISHSDTFQRNKTG